MESSLADLSTILDRILDTAADNLRTAKIFVSDGSRSEQHHLRRTFQSAAGNSAAQHHACQHVRFGWRHLSCRYLADAYNGADQCRLSGYSHTSKLC
jgi:hypothetical protein